ncbi:MAG TPA: hypothetical protein VFP20_04930 [Bacteroidales bacterium]|nr:hypothetical protein [Bacteroidales bacterium]
MKKIIGLAFLVALTFGVQAQNTESTNLYQNSADKVLDSNGKLVLGGYGEVHFNQPFSKDTRSNGSLDVHRMVLMLGYNFNPKTQFVSEIEFEHVSEVYVEQAFLQHKLNNQISLRAGLLLIPMGIVNEYHEPTTFNGVERPLVDNKISPTTWREIGFGLSGNYIDASLKYQAYLVNGFNGYNGKANLSGKNGFRNGRQKGAESFISSPNFAGKVEYYGIRNLNVGLSGYFGKTQSTLYNGINKSDVLALSKADSSVVGLAMLGADARYTLGGLQLRGQYYHANVSNTEQYNRFTAVNSTQNDLGSAMTGYYLEAGYNVLRTFTNVSTELIPFVRYEQYDTHASTAGALVQNKSYNNQAITTGLTYKLAKGAVVKTDLQFVKAESAAEFSKVWNVGVGVMF